MRARSNRVLTSLLNRVFLLLELRLLPGLAQRLVLVAALIAGLSLGGGAAVWIFDPEGRSFWYDVWWAFLHLTDPGYLGDDQGLARRIVATLLTVSGLVVFVGLLVAVMTQWMTQRITAFERGVTRVPFRDHVVILGWCNRTIALVRELLSSGPRVRQFLLSRGERGLRIVILDDGVDHAMHLALKDGLGDLYDPRRVLLRYGSPLRAEHLERAAIERATALILPAVDIDDATQVSSDAQVIKTLMAASAALEGSVYDAPPAVVELHDASKAELARAAYCGAVETLTAERFLAQLITQNVRYTGLSHVFRDLLTHSTGNELYAPRLRELEGVSFDEARRRMTDGVLLGWVTAGPRCEATLCPVARQPMPAGARALVVARSLDSCTPAPEPRATRSIRRGPREPDVRPRLERTLVLGWSRKLPALLAELDVYSARGHRVDVVSVRSNESRQAALARAGSTFENIAIRMIESEFTNRFELEALEPWACDDIVVVASDWIDDNDEADARSVLAYLMLRQVLAGRERQPDIVVELLDEASEPMLGSERHEVIVGPELISHMLTHVALRHELAPVFGDIFTPGGAEIILVSPGAYGIASGSYSFDELSDATADEGCVLLGVRSRQVDELEAQQFGGLSLNPDRSLPLVLRDGDELVVLAIAETSRPGEIRA